MNRLAILALLALLAACQTKVITPPPPVLPIPSEQQLAWHRMEMNAFIHFTTNTFTDKEWGYGDESPAVFNPTAVNTDQWTSILKQAGFKGVILTCKHHDGFCLWPTEFTAHSVKNSPWENGKGDLVGQLATSCKKDGLQFGIYVSPWDRNRADYGSPAYVDYYRKQLKELFTKYGPLFEMWFDGANGGDGYYGGARETRKINGATYYDWPTTLNLVRSFEPNVIFFSDAGPGVRWIGNENGIVGETNWNSITPDTLFAGKGGIEKLLNTGSEQGATWIPGEVDVSIRPGWFYHAREDSLVKTPEKLFDIYLTSVGRGSTLLLNVPPDKQGLFHDADIAALRGFRKMLDTEFANNLAAKSKITATSFRGDSDTYTPANLLDGKEGSYWATDDGMTTASVTLELDKPTTINYILLQEHIQLGQRVKSFNVEVWQNERWVKWGEGTTIGYKRILKMKPVNTQQIRVTILDAKACPLLSNLELY